MLDAELRNRIAECAIGLFDLVYEEYSLKGPTPKQKFDLRGKVAGQHRYYPMSKHQELRWNMEAARKYPADYLQQTVPHEVAHAVVTMRWLRGDYGDSKVYRPKPHGREWKEVMRLLGARPDRTHSYDLSSGRKASTHPYSCSCEGRVHHLGATRHRRYMRGERGYRCRDCKGILYPL